jgi:hypothetical protein
MAGGLDQHVALRLTQDHVMQVVTDPLKADVVLTDRIGAGFEDTLAELYAPPVEKEPEKQGDTFVAPPMRPLSRSRGAVFLVDRNTHMVLWSTFEEPKSTDPKDLYKAAQHIVERLAKSVKSD